MIDVVISISPQISLNIRIMSLLRIWLATILVLCKPGVVIAL